MSTTFCRSDWEARPIAMGGVHRGTTLDGENRNHPAFAYFNRTSGDVQYAAQCLLALPLEAVHEIACPHEGAELRSAPYSGCLQVLLFANGMVFGCGGAHRHLDYAVLVALLGDGNILGPNKHHRTRSHHGAFRESRGVGQWLIVLKKPAATPSAGSKGRRIEILSPDCGVCRAPRRVF